MNDPVPRPVVMFDEDAPAGPHPCPPAEPHLCPFAQGYRQDLLYTVLNATLIAPLVVALSLSFTEEIRRDLPWVVVPRLGSVPVGS